MIGLGNSVVKRKLAGASVPAAPVNILQPSLSGSGAVGEAVICNKGAWSGSPTPTYTYDFRLDSVSVQNSSSNSYTPLLADDGKTLTCLVTATNSQGSASEGTSNSIVIGIAPSNTVAPTLSPSGTQSTGTVITVGNGTFTGTAPLTYAYRWKRNGSIILGETANTYTIVAGDDGTVITAEVKATNAYGESAYISTSNQVDAVNEVAPSNVTAPVISGSTSLGSVLSCTTGTWTGTPATFIYTYQWMRNGVAILGANSNTYTTTLADSSAEITCVVTANNCNIIPPSNTVSPVLSGTAVVGQTLSVTNGAWDGTSPFTYTYNWFRGTTPIGTNTNSYTLLQADAGNTSNIKCVVTATNSAGSASADSNTVAQIFDATWWDFRQTLSITDTTINNAMNAYTITRKSISATASLGAYPMVGGTATTHSRNLYNAADTDAAKRVVWAGTITHNANGVQGNGTNGIGNTFINTSTEFSSNDFTVIWYSRTNQARNECDFGVTDISAGGLNMASKWGDNNTFTAGLSTNVNSGNVLSNSSGCFVFKRSGNTITLSRNGVNIITRTDAGNIKINQTIRIIGRWRSGLNDEVFSSKQYTHFEFLNFALNSTQETNIVNAVIAKETALSRNV